MIIEKIGTSNSYSVDFDLSVNNVFNKPLGATRMEIYSSDTSGAGINSVIVPSFDLDNAIVNTLTAGVSKLTFGSLASNGIYVSGMDIIANGSLATSATGAIFTATSNTGVFQVGDAVLLTAPDYSTSNLPSQHIYFVLAVNGAATTISNANLPSGTVANAKLVKLNYPAGKAFGQIFQGSVTGTKNTITIKGSLPYDVLAKSFTSIGSLRVKVFGKNMAEGFALLPVTNVDNTGIVAKNLDGIVDTTISIQSFEIIAQNGFAWTNAELQRTGQNEYGQANIILAPTVVAGGKGTIIVFRDAELSEANIYPKK